MSKPEIVIVGGGGHALVVAEAATLCDVRVRGCFDDEAETNLSRRLKIERLGSLADFTSMAGAAGAFILAMGDLALRARVVEALGSAGGRGATLVHPAAHVSKTARLGPGVYVGPGAVVHSFAEIGAHAIINSGAIVEHECVIGMGAHVAPGAVLGGGASIGASTLAGLGCRVLPRVAVGARCTIGAGAVVTRGVADAGLVVGVPARAANR